MCNHSSTVIAYKGATRLDAVFGRCPVRISVEISGVLSEICRGSPLYHVSRLISGHSLQSDNARLLPQPSQFITRVAEKVMPHIYFSRELFIQNV